MIDFKWTISSVEREINKDGLSDVIKTVHWRYRGTDEDGISSELYGAMTIGDPNPEDFTPWNKVSEEDVIGWLEDIFNTTPPIEGDDKTMLPQLKQMQQSIEQRIELLKNPTTITSSLYSSPSRDITK